MRSHDTHRTERVASVIKRDVAVILESDVADPRVAGASVVDATISHDLRNATVYVCIDGDEAETLAALTKCAGYIRHQLAERNREMRIVPQLKFVADRSQSYYNRVDRIIRELHSNEDNG